MLIYHDRKIIHQDNIGQEKVMICIIGSFYYYLQAMLKNHDSKQ